jgi:DNA recombination protein RmuC
LANDILEEKTKRFTEQNQTNLSQLLTPLAVQIKSFQQKVEEVYVQEGKDRSALSEQVRLLMGLNQQLSTDTSNLTRALTTSAKAQGDLGEMILEKILESSGLRKDEEYFVQNSFRNEDSRQARPDVIVKLPENKHLIIDSKVSLTAYNDYVNAETDEARKAALARHMDSVRRHIKELAEKNYQSLHQLQSIDFVCMFVPIEGAFMAAISNDSELWASSYARNVLLVSPSTLLFVVRTVAHLWRQERQKQNVAEIVKRGAELHDKLVGFVEDLKSVGDRLDQAKSSYSEAFSKLATGKGNVIRQAVMLKELGVKPKKNLPPDLVDASAEDEPLLPEQVDAASTP